MTVYNKAAFELAHARMRLAPIELTEPDLEQLGTVDPLLETKGREALRQAQLSIVYKHTPVLQTKDASTVDRSQLPVTRKFLHKNFEAFADQFGDALLAILKKNVVPLKEQIAELKARVLEFEASAAARTVEHADR
jgi:hypothetical protein